MRRARSARDYLVGFGFAGASDPGSTDISANLAAGLSICTTSVPNLALGVSARPIVGTAFDLETVDAPAATLFGMSLLGATGYDPGVDLGLLGMPGCKLHTSLEEVILFVPIAGAGSLTWPVPNTPSLAGAVVFAQSAAIVPGINPFGAVTSNGLRLTVGMQ